MFLLYQMHFNRNFSLLIMNVCMFCKLLFTMFDTVGFTQAEIITPDKLMLSPTTGQSHIHCPQYLHSIYCRKQNHSHSEAATHEMKVTFSSVTASLENGMV